MVKRTTSIDKLWSFHGLALALHAQALLDGIVATTWDERTRLVRSVGVENPWRKPVQYVQCTMYNNNTTQPVAVLPFAGFFPDISMTGEWD
jgi:hypothetical protein